MCLCITDMFRCLYKYHPICSETSLHDHNVFHLQYHFFRSTDTFLCINITNHWLKKNHKMKNKLLLIHKILEFFTFYMQIYQIDEQTIDMYRQHSQNENDAQWITENKMQVFNLNMCMWILQIHKFFKHIPTKICK